MIWYRSDPGNMFFTVDHAGCTAPARQHELKITQIIQIRNVSALTDRSINRSRQRRGNRSY